MKVGDIVVVANLGEMKVYKAEPRDLEAEAGLKPQNIKLDLINAMDYVEAHWKLKDVVTDEAGRFKSPNGTNGGTAEKNGIEAKLEEDVIKAIAEDIARFVKESNPPKFFLALPQTIFARVWKRVNSDVQSKLFRYVEEDLTKTNKNKLPDIFKEKGKHF